MQPLPRVFDMLLQQYFKTILPSVESLLPSQQDEVYFRVGDTAGGLRHQQQWLPSWILPRVRNQFKTAINIVIFCAWHVKYYINKHFASFHPQALHFIVERS